LQSRQTLLDFSPRAKERSGRDLSLVSAWPRCSPHIWEREGRDSNPRGSFTPPTRLAGGCFRPLSHLPDQALPSLDSIGPDLSSSLSILSTRWRLPADQAPPRCGGPD